MVYLTSLFVATTLWPQLLSHKFSLLRTRYRHWGWTPGLPTSAGNRTRFTDPSRDCLAPGGIELALLTRAGTAYLPGLSYQVKVSLTFQHLEGRQYHPVAGARLGRRQYCPVAGDTLGRAWKVGNPALGRESEFDTPGR